MPFILVSPISALESTIEAYGPSHLISLLSPEYMIETPRRISPERHLRLALNDVADATGCEAPPTERHVERLLAFGDSWPAEAPMLVHCWAGVSRSTAAAYTLLCQRAGPGCEFALAQLLRARATHAYPNPLIIRFADAALKRDGRMVAAVESIGRGEIVAVGRCFELPLSFLR